MSYVARSWGIGHVSVPVSDVDRAVRFYCEHFGFVPYHTGEADWAMVSRGETSLSFIRSERSDSGASPSSSTHASHFGILVPSPSIVDEMRGRLVAAGVSVGKAVSHRDGSYGFYFRDSDGNMGECIFVLHRSKSESLLSEARILIAHGSKNERWGVPIEAIRRRVELHLSGSACVVAYLERQAPDLHAAAEALFRNHPSLRRVFVVPLFFSGAGHVENDVRPLFEAIRADYPEVEWHLSPAIGESERVQEAIAAKICWIGSDDSL